TTARARPSGPRSLSRNSRTSRPRSPTRQTTVISAAVPRVVIEGRESSADLDDGAGEAVGAEVVVEELAHLATPLADQADDGDLGGGTPGDHREEGELCRSRRRRGRGRRGRGRGRGTRAPRDPARRPGRRR